MNLFGSDRPKMWDRALAHDVVRDVVVLGCG